MSRGTVRWIFYFAAMFIVGPIAGSLVALLRAADGGPHATLLVNTSLLDGLLVGVAVFVMAGAMGAAAARLTDSRAGLSTAGLVLVWAAWRGGRVDELLRTAESAAPLWSLAAEGAIFGTAAIVTASLIMLVARKNPDLPDGERPAGFKNQLIDAVAGSGVPVAVITVTLVTAAIVWWLVFSEYKGQVILGATLAMFFGVTAGRVASHLAPPHCFFLAVVVLAVLGPAVGVLAQGGSILRATYASDLLPIARLTPLDWIAAGFLGGPLGLAWASSLIQRHQSTS